MRLGSRAGCRQLFDCANFLIAMAASLECRTGFKQSSSSENLERGNRSTPWILSRAIQAANLHVVFAASQFARSHCRIADDDRSEACGLLAAIGVVKWLFQPIPKRRAS
jgi:hypothetical protein